MIELRTLKSNLRVAMEEMPHVNSVSVGIWVRAGAVDEEARTAGISHFIEHMMFKGTPKRSARQLAEEMDAIGAQMNAFTGKEATCYYVKSLSANVEKALDILLDMFTNSLFDREEMEKEKNVIYEEIKMVKDTPDEEVHDIINELVFKGHPLGQSITGTKSTLKPMTGRTLRRYINDEYTKDSIVVAIAGNFDKDKLCGIIETGLSGLNPSKPVKTHEESPYRPRFRVKIKDTEQTHLCLGTRSISMDDPRYYAFACLNNILGASMSSRLFQNIREQKGLAYTVYSMNSSFRNEGYYNIYAGVSHQRTRETLEAILEEISLLGLHGVTGEELSTAKEQLKSTYIFGMENVNGRMFSIGKNAIMLDRVYTPEEVLSKIDGVTDEGIWEAAALIKDPADYSAAVITAKQIPLGKLVQNAGK